MFCLCFPRAGTNSAHHYPRYNPGLWTPGQHVGHCPVLGFHFPPESFRFPKPTLRGLLTTCPNTFPDSPAQLQVATFCLLLKNELRSKERWRESGRGDTGKGWDLAHPFLRPSHPRGPAVARHLGVGSLHGHGDGSTRGQFLSGAPGWRGPRNCKGAEFPSLGPEVSRIRGTEGPLFGN